jgi:hypothetical protein
MYLSLEKILKIIVYFVIVIKVFFYSSAIGTVVCEHYKPESEITQKFYRFFSYWREKTEIIYFISMALLLIIIFNPSHNHKKYINQEIGILFWLFGFIIIVTSNWSGVAKDIVKWYKSMRKNSTDRLPQNITA